MASDPRTLVFLHGAGGPAKQEQWLEPLNQRLAQAGYSRFDPSHDRVIAPGYLADLQRTPAGPEPATTWKRGDEKAYRRAKLAYLQRQDELARVARSWERFRAGPDASWLSEDFAGDSWFTDIGVNWLKPVRAYQNDKLRRWAVQRTILNQLPRSGSIVLVAHSLGSVIAVDLLTKLPPNLKVDLLLTIGSPLAIRRIGHPGFDRDFPYDRIGGWVNLYDSGDFVTIGRGVSKRFPAACDISVQTGEDHDAIAYLSNPAAAAAIGHSMYGSSRPEGPGGVQRLLHPAWHPLLLSFAYSTQLSACATGDDWRFKARIDTARALLAKRTLDDVQARRQQLSDEEAPRIDASPLGEGRHPSEADLLHHAADLVRDTWTDDALLALAVGLAMSPPLPPFDIDVSDDRRQEALLKTLNRVRRRQGNISDQEFADAVRAAVKNGKEAVRQSAFPWGTVLIGTGLVLLSLTGIGLMVAAPVGLAGAAVITGTLAAFGPGGMIGGLVTIATLTGVGAAATGIGVGVGTAEDPLVVERARRLAVEELVAMPLAELRNALAAVLAVVDAQPRLGLESTSTVVEELITSALDAVRTECQVHEEVAPDRPGTSLLKEKIDLLERALRWLEEKHLNNDAWRRAQQRLAELPESLGAGAAPRRSNAAKARSSSSGDLAG